MMRIPLRHTVLFFLGVATLFAACRKDDNRVPNVPVNIQVNINNPAYIDLNAIGGWVYASGGSRGLVIYRESIDRFRTYDRHSTWQVPDNCTVVVDSTNLFLQDPCSTSRFLITDGSVIEGPASIPLTQYQTSFDGTFLRVFN